MCPTNFDFLERRFLVSEFSVNVLGLLRRLAADAELHLLAQGVRGRGRHEFLSPHPADNLRPERRLALTLELQPYRVDDPVQQQPEEQVRLASPVFLVIDRPQVEVVFD